MKEMLKDQTIAVTGASSGIGAEMAQTFVEQGARVILLARSTQKLEQLAAKLGERAVYYSMDVSSSPSVREVFQTIAQKHRTIDVLVNNAGFGLFKSFDELTDEQFEAMMNVNYMGIVRCTKQVLPMMLERGSGQIVNIASLAGKVATAKSTAYTASKHAVIGFTNSLRQELKGSGIAVSAINPGPIRTPFFTQADPSGEYLNSMPSWFVLSPEKVAQAVLRTIVRKKRETNLPAVGGFAAKLSQVMPGLFDKLAGGIINKK